MSDGHENTKHGGVRRTGIVQRQNTAQIKRRRMVQLLNPVHIKLKEKLGLPECPYAIRWRIDFPFGSVRVHHWLSHDDPRAVHDHPWWFLTFVVRGGYTDLTEDHAEHLEAPAVRFRHANHKHTVFPCPGGAWTILITGRPLRKWGFYKDEKFYKANKWFLTYGHHPCD